MRPALCWRLVGQLLAQGLSSSLTLTMHHLNLQKRKNKLITGYLATNSELLEHPLISTCHQPLVGQDGTSPVRTVALRRPLILACSSSSVDYLAPKCSTGKVWGWAHWNQSNPSCSTDSGRLSPVCNWWRCKEMCRKSVGVKTFKCISWSQETTLSFNVIIQLHNF